MHLRFILVFICLLGTLFSTGQSVIAFLADSRRENQSALLRDVHLQYPDSIESGIRYLMRQAKQRNKQGLYLDALNSLQLALVLEEYVAPNTQTVFDLNNFMGRVLADFSPRYALLFMKKAVTITRIRPELDKHKERFQMLGVIAGLHNTLTETDSARFWYRQALSEAYARCNAPGQASALNNLGFFYSELGHADSAMYYFQFALRTLGSIKLDTMLYCSISDNIAQEHERKGDYGFAIRTYRLHDTIFSRRKRWNRILLNRIRLLNAAYMLGHTGVAGDINHLANFVEQHRPNLLDRDVLRFYKFAKDFFLKTGNINDIRRYDLILNSVKDSIERKNKMRTELVSNAFLNIQATHFRDDVEAYRTESATARKIAWIILIAGLISVGLLSLLMHRRKRELKLAHRLTVAELRAKELEAQAMTQALALQKRDITMVALHNTQVLGNTRRILLDRLTALNTREKEQTERGIRTLIGELQAQEQLNERVQLIQENIDRVNTEFYQTLKIRFPAMTKSEVELCGYLRIGLSNKDIAVLKNIAASSVKMGKNRLRKKLELPAEEDLYEFLRTF